VEPIYNPIFRSTWPKEEIAMKKWLEIASVLIVCGTLQSTAPCGAQSLKVGMTSKTLFYLPFYVGQKKGFYNGENLKVELILIGRSDVQLQALIAG
jgi:ABC-type nitrate/sulfonate/bicarbonate transport system substrate-binding protein